jgi:Bacterial type II and III secretion system protein
MIGKQNLPRKGKLVRHFGPAIIAVTAMLFGWLLPLHSQSRQLIKVLLESQQSGTQSREAVQGSGSVIIRRGNVEPSGRLRAGDRETTVQRSTGIFTLVQDGGESILTVATRVPYNQAVFYRDYATGAGYIARSVVFSDVGTSLKVSANILPGDQVRVLLTPRISYFSSERAGAIDFTEASTELIVPNGQPVSLGGSTTKMHQVTRQILGYSDRASTSETSLVVTATIQ